MADFNGQDFAAPSHTLLQALAEPSALAQTYAITGGGGVATIAKYLMRGKRSGVPEYWYATFVDSAGAENPIGPSGLSEIVFIKIHFV